MIIVIEKSPPEDDSESDEESVKPPPPPPPKADPPPPPPPPKEPQKFSKFVIVSIILLLIALAFGATSIYGTTEAENLWIELYDTYMEFTDNEQYKSERILAIGMAAASAFCFTVAILFLFFAGLRYKKRGEREGRMNISSAFSIAAWITFVMVLILNIIILVVSFDDDLKPIWPEGIWIAVIGNFMSWLFMFGYAEVSRRTYMV